MTKRAKRLAKIRNSTKGVRADELDALLTDYGFTRVPGKGDHRLYRHPDRGASVTIDPRHPVLQYAVKQVLKAIDAVRDAKAEENSETAEEEE